jgi:hypothetical protein
MDDSEELARQPVYLRAGGRAPVVTVIAPYQKARRIDHAERQ